MRTPPGLAAVIIQQIGNFVYLALWVIAAQYLLSMVQGKPEESWVWQLRAAWLMRRSHAEERRLSVWARSDASTEPQPEG